MMGVQGVSICKLKRGFCFCMKPIVLVKREFDGAIAHTDKASIFIKKVVHPATIFGERLKPFPLALFALIERAI